MREVGIGIIGTGWMGEVYSLFYVSFAKNFYFLDLKLKLMVCSDSVYEKLKECKDKFSFKQTTKNYEDVIDITAPNHLHLPIIEMATKLKKTVNCEKPVRANTQETLKAYEIVKGIISVGCNYRHALLVMYVKGLIGSGRIGRMTYYNGGFSHTMLLSMLLIMAKVVNVENAIIKSYQSEKTCKVE